MYFSSQHAHAHNLGSKCSWITHIVLRSLPFVFIIYFAMWEGDSFFFANCHAQLLTYHAIAFMVSTFGYFSRFSESLSQSSFIRVESFSTNRRRPRTFSSSTQRQNLNLVFPSRFKVQGRSCGQGSLTLSLQCALMEYCMGPSPHGNRLM